MQAARPPAMRAAQSAAMFLETSVVLLRRRPSAARHPKVASASAATRPTRACDARATRTPRCVRQPARRVDPPLAKFADLPPVKLVARASAIVRRDVLLLPVHPKFVVSVPTVTTPALNRAPSAPTATLVQQSSSASCLQCCS